MKIQGLTKTTLLDYPGRLACTIFFGGCNFRCPFCYNTPLVLHPESEPGMESGEVLEFLRKRKGILEGVCVSGGEPTLIPGLSGFLSEIKELGFLVKLDSNGYNPDILKELAGQSLIDYIAMDVKTNPKGYPETSGLPGLDIGRIKESVSFLMGSGIDYEFRTTVVRQFHSAETFLDIGRWLCGCRAYYLQSFHDTGDTIGTGLSSYTKEELQGFVDLLTPFIPNTKLRGVG